MERKTLSKIQEELNFESEDEKTRLLLLKILHFRDNKTENINKKKPLIIKIVNQKQLTLSQTMKRV